MLVDRGVIATANELLRARQYAGVIALVDGALGEAPDSTLLLLVRARARIALHLDAEAQADLRAVVRIDPRCSLAYRLLGELSARRDENRSAAVFFREALRLAPDDRDAADWLAIVEREESRANSPRLAKGTTPPEPVGEPAPRVARGSRPATPTAPLLRPTPKPIQQRPIPELPGFGDYLVAIGLLTRERLRAAQAYQRSMRVQLSTAIVTLGLATHEKIEWAAVAHQSDGKR